MPASYPAMVQAEVAAFGDGCAYVNREDDAGDRGLRTSKLQYGPCQAGSQVPFPAAERAAATMSSEIPGAENGAADPFGA